MLRVVYSKLRALAVKSPRIAIAGLAGRALLSGKRVRVIGDARKRILVQSKERGVVVAYRHYPYVQDVLDDFDYYFDAVLESTEQFGLQTVDYSQGAEHTLRSSGKRFYFTSLPEADHTTDIYLEKAALRPGDIVLDGGAYCGASAYMFASRVYGGGWKSINFRAGLEQL